MAESQESSGAPKAFLRRQSSFFRVARVAQIVYGFAKGRAEVDEDPIEARKKALATTKEQFIFFTNKSAADVMKDLRVSPQTGLSSEEASARLTDHGPNALAKDPPKPFWRLLLEQFSDLLVIMLIVAAIVSGGLGDYESSVSILVIVIANAVLGVVQESRAEAALDALESLSAPTTTVLRDGAIKEVDSEQVVPGDIVILETGKRISADMRLIQSEDLTCGEMALTGESEPVKKDATHIAGKRGGEEKKEEVAKPVSAAEPAAAGGEKKKEEALTDANMAYMGCVINDGHGKGVVVKTGMQTKMGEIAHLLKGADKGLSPLQKKLEQLGTRLGIISIILSIIVFVIGVTTGRGSDPTSDQPVWLQMLLVAVSLTVASVPEGLPACVTITLAIGMREMVKRKALIRNLRSVETLGSASVICTDKTGTLTKGIMTAVRAWYGGQLYRITGQGYDPKGYIVPLDTPIGQESDAAERVPRGSVSRPFFFALLCSNARLQFNQADNAWECVGNASERPLVVAASKVGFDASGLEAAFPRVKEFPFNSTRKMMAVLVDARKASADLRTEMLGRENANTPFFTTVKGAPNFVLRQCTHMLDGPNGAVKALSEEDVQRVLRVVDEFSAQAFRVLAIAYAPLANAEGVTVDQAQSGLTLAGLVASIDPERPEVGPSIQKAYAAGVRVVMITGDYVKTAKAIAENIGLLPRGAPENKAVDCDTIRPLGLKIDEFDQRINAATGAEQKQLKSQRDVVYQQLDAITKVADVYARAKPVDKITIVRSLQRQGNVCSMTGDGVNDAPALKQANIGVAMGITGTDVAKSSSDMVLIDDNFCSIVDAIEQGRTVYANIQKFVFYLLSTNVSEVLTILIPVIMGLPSPLVPIQILYMNLATDGAPAIALAMEASEPGVMSEGPRPEKEPLIDKIMLSGIIIHNFVLTFTSILTYCVGLQWFTGSWNADRSRIDDGYISADDFQHGVDQARTMVILVISFAELLRAYSCRALRLSVFQQGFFTNRIMQYSISVSIALTFFIALCPGVMTVFDTKYIPGRAWAWVIGWSFVPFIVDELTKAVYRHTGFGFRQISAVDDQTGLTSGLRQIRVFGGSYDRLAEEEKESTPVYGTFA